MMDNTDYLADNITLGQQVILATLWETNNLQPSLHGLKARQVLSAEYNERRQNLWQLSDITNITRTVKIQFFSTVSDEGSYNYFIIDYHGEAYVKDILTGLVVNQCFLHVSFDDVSAPMSLCSEQKVQIHQHTLTQTHTHTPLLLHPHLISHKTDIPYRRAP